MSVKILWLIAVVLNLIYQLAFKQTPIQAFYSFLFSMFGVLFFYLSWIIDLLINKNGQK